MGRKQAAEDAVHYLSERASYQLKDGQDELNVVLKGESKDGLTLTKSFVFHRGQYQVELKDQIQNSGAQDWDGRFWARLQQKTTDAKEKGVTGFRTFNGASYYTQEVPFNKLKYNELDQKSLMTEVKKGWIAFQQHYFISTFVFDQAEMYRLHAQSLNNGVYQFAAATPMLKLKPGQKSSHNWSLYAGPEVVETLKGIAPGLDHTVDYGWLWMISIVMLYGLKKIYFVVGNWGVSIILITLCIKLLFFRMSSKSFKSMAKMRKLQPQIKAIQDQYGDDRQMVGMETMKLYQREQVNSLRLFAYRSANSFLYCAILCTD